MTREEVESAVRAWARRSPLLPLGFLSAMRVRRVRDAEVRRTTEYVDLIPRAVRYDPPPGEIPAWALRDAVGQEIAVTGTTARHERIPVTLATVEYDERDYEVLIVGENRIVHIDRPPRAWVRIALIAGLVVTGLGLFAARLLTSPSFAPVGGASEGKPPPPRVEPAERTVLCPGCDGKGCSACGNRGRLPIEGRK